MTQTVTGRSTARILLLALGVVLLLSGCDPVEESSGAQSVATSETTVVGTPILDSPSPTPAKAAAQPAAKPAPKPAAKPPTVAQREALQAAQQYVDISGYSKAGLLRQLTSEYADDFEKADATWAVEHVNADWNAEAVEAALQYMEIGGYSRSGLIKQLTSKYADQFTKAQAQYAAKKVGL